MSDGPRPTPPAGRRGVKHPTTPAADTRSRPIPADTPRLAEDKYLRLQATRLAVDVLKTRAIVSAREVVTWADTFTDFIRDGQVHHATDNESH